MPNVQEIFQENLKKGMASKDAAKDAQKRTGLSLRTGLPPKRTRPTLKTINRIPGQFPRKFT